MHVVPTKGKRRTHGADPARAETEQGIEAEVSYLDPSGGRPVSYAYEPPPGVPRRSGIYCQQKVTIRDARGVRPAPSLDLEGFRLVPHRSRVENFYDEIEIKRVYYPEVETLLKRVTGAMSVLVFDHTIRGTVPETHSAAAVRPPITSVHNDYTVNSGPRRAHTLLAERGSVEMLRHPFAEINVWRAIRGPLQMMPLAICDASSMRATDFIIGDIVYPDRVGEFYAIACDPGHRWWYFSDLWPDEALLVKCYDSDESRSRFGAHGAFSHPRTPPDAPARESIEVRAFVFFTPLDETAGDFPPSGREP